MRKLLKILIIGLGGLFALGFAFSFALRTFLPQAQVRKWVEGQIRQQLNREASLGPVQLGLLGLTLDHFKLSDVPSFKAGTFLDVGPTRVRWSLIPFLPKKIVVHIRQGTLYSGTTAAGKFPSTLSDIALVLHDVTQTQAQGQLTIGRVKNPVYAAQDLSAEWNLRDIDSSLGRVNGWMRMHQGPGRIENLERFAAASPGARLALLPLLALQNLDRAGLVNLGLPDLSHLAIQHITGDYGFKAGTMTINTFKIDSPELTAEALGTIQLASQQLAVTLNLHTPKPTALGDTDIKISVGGTLSNPKTNLDSLKKKAFKATVSHLLQDPNTAKTIDKTLKRLFH